VVGGCVVVGVVVQVGLVRSCVCAVGVVVVLCGMSGWFLACVWVGWCGGVLVSWCKVVVLFLSVVCGVVLLLLAFKTLSVWCAIVLWLFLVCIFGFGVDYLLGWGLVGGLGFLFQMLFVV